MSAMLKKARDDRITMSLQATLGNAEWMAANAEKIKAMLPETWTDVCNLNGLQLGFKMKLLGIDWRSVEEFAKTMTYFERVGLMKRDGLLVRRAR